MRRPEWRQRFPGKGARVSALAFPARGGFFLPEGLVNQGLEGYNEEELFTQGGANDAQIFPDAL